MLTIQAGSLKYAANRVYEILVSTNYLDEEYQQYIRIGIIYKIYILSIYLSIYLRIYSL